MPANISIFSNEERTLSFETVTLGEISSGIDFFSGEPRKVFAKNSGDTNLLSITIDLSGAGADYVQLALDDNDSPGVWAESGKGIIIGDVPKGENFTFWTRGHYNFDSFEGAYNFDFVMRGVSA